MSTQSIPIAALQKVRQHLKSALIVPESENFPVYHSEEPPLPESINELGNLFHFGSTLTATKSIPNDRGQWFISTTNPGAALLRLPGLKLKTGFRLVSYLYRDGKNGSGVVWAVPEALSTTTHLEKVLCSDLPKPEGALTSFMDAIEGEPSPMSFVIASILRRELLEFGAIGDCKKWGHHCLIEQLAVGVPVQWQIQPVKDFVPKVGVDRDQQIIVQFFTARSVAQGVVLFQHVDCYAAGGYRAKVLDSFGVLRSTNRAVAIFGQTKINGRQER